MGSRPIRGQGEVIMVKGANCALFGRVCPHGALIGEKPTRYGRTDMTFVHVATYDHL